MKSIRYGIFAVLTAVSICSLTACSATDVFDDLVEDTVEGSQTAGGDSTRVIKNIDTTLTKPVFKNDLNGSVPLVVGDTFNIDGTATSTDGGIISYQWYKNNVNSNGGGTPIKDATAAIYTVEAVEEGSVFYYVVATNNHGENYNSAASGTFEVIAHKAGKWISDEYGKKYMDEDGNFIVNFWINIDGDTYHFDENGYATVGWYPVGNVLYYFDEEGRILRNGTTPDGFQTNEEGILIGDVMPSGVPGIVDPANEAAIVAEQAAENIGQ